MSQQLATTRLDWYKHSTKVGVHLIPYIVWNGYNSEPSKEQRLEGKLQTVTTDPGPDSIGRLVLGWGLDMKADTVL